MPNLYTAKLFGSWQVATSTTSTGNTLQMESSGLTVRALGSFQKLNFQLPTIPAAGAPVLIVTEDAFVATDALTVQVSAPGLTVAEGDQITLIHANPLAGTFTPSGTINGHTFTLSATATDLVLTVGALAPTAAAATAVPTLGEWSLLALALSAAGLGARRLRRRATAA
jgi:hypothetical protein